MVLDAAAATLAREPGSVDRLVRLAAADMAGVDALITARMQSEVPVIPALAEELHGSGGGSDAELIPAFGRALTQAGGLQELERPQK